MTEYIIDLDALIASPTFLEASKEELRVLMALVASKGAANTVALSKLANVSKPRALSTLSLFEEAGVISKSEGESSAATITYEFEEDPLRSGAMEEDSDKVASTIRDSGLAELISELAALMERPALGTQETKCIVALYSHYALSAEYILTLASHLKHKGKLTAKRLCDKGCSLVDKEGIDTVEELEIYISARESENGTDMEFRKLFSIWNRSLTKPEKDYFKHWTEDLGYGTPIVGEAYDIAVEQTGDKNLSYMNKVLENWHKAGLKTVQECRMYSEAGKGASKKAKSSKSESSSSPKYADFSAEDALMAALKRSYGEDSDEGEEE